MTKPDPREAGRPRLVLVGNGMAGVRALEEILARAPHAFAITVFGAEPHGGYNRIMLSPVLAGERTFEAITTHPRSWYHENAIELIAPEPVIGIDRAAKTVTGALGTTRRYDVLILATGSNPVIIPLPGHDLPGVIGFRDIADVERMIAASKSGRNAVVIGGGLLGLEAANGLARNGMATTVLHLMPTLMERQLDPVSADLLRADLGARGIKVITEADTKAIIGTSKVEAVQLADGTRLPADIVVMAAGIRPNIALARQAGLACARGVEVDDALLTSDPRVHALGECVQHRGALFGLVEPLYDMARIVADRVCGTAASTYTPAPTGTRLKVTGIDMFSAGDFVGDDTTDHLVFRDPARGVHKKLVVRDDRLIGAVLYGEAADSAWYFNLICNEIDVSALRDTLLFGPVETTTVPLEALPEIAEIDYPAGSGGVLLAVTEL
ncbi:NAD(P)/FAD-dependent oxidoreductase [Rhodopila sp.]|uniref:NAD(P)/FAD-dependent oxidoreductase n=1 Tax=Rhodopila sp. TaxID=2480087 RepID=UPI003D10F3C7